MTAALEVTDLTTSFGPVCAVQGVSFEVPHGGTFVLLGESGSGKSVTARSVLRLHGRSASVGGSVRLAGEELLTRSPEQMRAVRGSRIAMVPQDPTGALDPLRSIGSQLVEALRSAAAASGHQVPSRAQAKERSHELLASVGIPDPRRVGRSRPHEMSGGMRQRAVIAIAVCAEPDVLIADEPTTALDVTVQAQVLEVFRDLQHRLGTALVLVTHDVGVADEFSGQVGVMYAGRLVETGPIRQVLDAPAHPYTRGLLESLPRPGVDRGRLTAIAGRPPLTGEQFPGCPFAPRCPSVEPSCLQERPTLLPAGDGRAAACPVELAPLVTAVAAS